MEAILFGIGGLVVGFFLGMVRGRQASPAAPELFDEDDVAVDPRMSAARAAVSSRTEKRLNRIMATARESGRITNDGVEELFCISDRTASTYLRELMQRGELRRNGVGRGTFYTPSRPFDTASE
jgi:predicted HTH transcriptional regulator